MNRRRPSSCSRTFTATSLRGFSLAELVVAMASASVLLAGLGSAVMLSTEAFRPETNRQEQRTSAAFVERDLLADLRLATGFSERTSTATTFTVPDRDGDSRPDTLRYAWSGVVGDPLTLAFNGGTPTTVLTDLRAFALDYRTAVVNGQSLPAEQTGSPILLVVNDSQSLTSKELSRKDLLESWDFQVTIKGLNDPSSDLLNAAGAVQAVYISGSINAASFTAASALSAMPVGIVNESRDLIDDLGFGATTDTTTTWSLNVSASSHYINQDISGSTATPVILLAPLVKMNGQAAGALNSILTLSSLPSLSTLDPGEAKYGGGNAAGRRVYLPWGSDSTYTPLNLSETGRLLMCRSVEWATGLGAESADLGEFGYNQIFASNNTNKANMQLATKATLSETGKVISITAYVGGSSNKDIRYAIYANSSGEPGARTG